MATQQQLDKVYMQNAVNMSTLSYAIRKKVGCILVTPGNLQIGSYNGQPSGWDNVLWRAHKENAGVTQRWSNRCVRSQTYIGIDTATAYRKSG